MKSKKKKKTRTKERLPPATDSAFIPPLLTLLPQVVLHFCLPIPSNPLSRLPLGRSRLSTSPIHAIPIEKTLFHGLAHEGLLLDALVEQLVERGGAEARKGEVHVGLFLAPLALKGVHGEQLGLGGGALVGEAGLELGEARGEVDVGGEGGKEVLVGGLEGRVDGGGGVCEAVEEGGVGEDIGEVLDTVCFERGGSAGCLWCSFLWSWLREGNSRFILKHLRKPLVSRI